MAEALCLGLRTLPLRLRPAGHSYQQLLDEVRRELAERHLREHQYSPTDIAFLLGFAEPSVFVRSFRRWAGQTPRAFRRQLAGAWGYAAGLFSTLLPSGGGEQRPSG